MTTTNTDILTNGQTAQEQGAEQAPCSVDTQKVMQKLPDNMSAIYFDKEASANENYLKLITTVTADYLYGIDRCYGYYPRIMSELRKKTIDAFKAFNKEADKRGMQRLDVPRRLNAYQIARLFMALNHVLLVPEKTPGSSGSTSPGSGYEVVIYRDGCYWSWELSSYELADTLSESLNHRFNDSRDYYLIMEVRFWLCVLAEKAEPYHGQELIPVLNGIFNCRTGQLMAYSPQYVFRYKEDVYCLEGRNGLVMHHRDGRDESVDDWLKRIRENSAGGN